MTTNRIENEARNFMSPTPNMIEDLKRERKAYEAFVAQERAKKFIVRDDFGSSRFFTLKEAEKWANENAAILWNPVIETA